MTMLAQSLSVEAMADSLQLESFGKWARSGDNIKRLQNLSSPMFREYRSGYPETRRCVPDIDDDSAMRIDQMMTRLTEIERDVLILYYVFGMSIRSICRILGNKSRRFVEDAKRQGVTRLHTLQSEDSVHQSAHNPG